MFRSTSVVMTTTAASRIDRVVAGEQADRGRCRESAQVVELLVRERLDRRGVERPGAVGQRAGHRVLGHDRLAAPGRGGDEHRLPGIEGVERLELERVEREGVASRQRARGRGAPGSVDGSGVARVDGQDRCGRLGPAAVRCHQPMHGGDEVQQSIGTESAARLIGSPLGVITAAMTMMTTMA